MIRVTIPSEHIEQAHLVIWYRHTWPDVRIFAIPNGGYRSKATAGRLKAEGVSAGVPDLYIPAWRCWIELKRSKGGSVSAAQRDWIKYLQGIGDTVIIAHGADDAKEKIMKHFINLSKIDK